MSHTYSILGPTKKLSQLIANSWLNGQQLPSDKQELKEFLVSNDIFSNEEAKLFEIEILDGSSQGEGYIDAANFEVRIPYAERPQGVTDQELEEWINSPEDSPPWVPENENLKKVLIPWKTIYSR
ncbi:MAG TPA: hypothetical protein V6C90_19280 [Coleofasciculaceae cyanobacterium]|jgi:hypothetical protein